MELILWLIRLHLVDLSCVDDFLDEDCCYKLRFDFINIIKKVIIKENRELVIRQRHICFFFNIFFRTHCVFWSAPTALMEKHFHPFFSIHNDEMELNLKNIHQYYFSDISVRTMLNDVCFSDYSAFIFSYTLNTLKFFHVKNIRTKRTTKTTTITFGHNEIKR